MRNSSGIVLMVRLGFDASNLALLGALLCLIYLEVGLQLGPDQVAEMVVGGLWLIPVLLVLDFIAGLAAYRPIYQLLRECFSGGKMAPERAAMLWRKLFVFPAQAMFISAAIWIGGAVAVAWWMTGHGAVTARQAVIAFPCSALLGLSTSVVFYFRARAIIRPVLESVSSSLPAGFEVPRTISIRLKLMASIAIILAAVALSFGSQTWFWRERGPLDAALAAANESIERVAGLIRKGNGAVPALPGEENASYALQPFVVDFEGKPAGGAGNISAADLAVVNSHPRLLGLAEWESTNPFRAGIARVITGLIPLPEEAPLPMGPEALGWISELIGAASAAPRWVVLRREPLPGGLHPGAIISLKPLGPDQARRRALSNRFLAACIGILILIVILYAFWLTLDISEPIAELRSVMDRVSRGSAPKPAPLQSDDEIGALALSFNRMSAILGEQMERGERSIATVRAAFANLARIVGNIAGAASSQAAGASEQAASLHQISTTSEEIAATLRVIAENASNVEQVAGQTLSSCHSGQNQLQEVVSGMNMAMARANDVAFKMLNFQEQAMRIEGILDFIRGISERTNMIALNASIEASAVGDAGDRFGIIAAEMRKLAEQTMSGTKDVKNIFNELQAATGSAIIATEEGEKKVKAALKLTDHASESFQSIVHWAGETARSAQEIALSSNQQTTATDHLAAALGEVREVAGKFAAAAKSMESSISELRRLGDELGALLGPEQDGAPAPPNAKEGNRDQ
ncbi:MAG TPA: methyl-accepting chemotaxis protein [bacterium]|nr:methyl-accepting chemotaxis protein [bacterium]